jgi:CheY-like chemotaxis protein
MFVCHLFIYIYIYIYYVDLLLIFYIVNQKIAISILKRLGYQDVIIAGNGREALDLMRIHKFDVIFVS